MKRSLYGALLLGLLVLWRTPSLAAPGTPSLADPVYQQALISFLAGDYDKALIQSAQALEKDPAHQKTRNLINVLAAEKEQDGKTVIWLAGKPALVPATQVPAPLPVQEDSGLRDEVTGLKQKVENYYRGLLGRQDGMQGQMKVVQELVRDNSQAQYAEVRASQVAIYQKLKEIEKGQDLRWLYLLCGASLLLSFFAFFRRRKA